jgi:hypothetical protein
MAAAATAAAFPTAVNLSFHGVYAYVRSNPDLGTTYFFLATTNVPGVGLMGVTGSITTPGFVATGHATGTLTILSAKGSIAMSVTGPAQPGFSPLPSQLGFTVTSATGFFRFVHGSGTVTINLHPAIGNTATRGNGNAPLIFREP